jgi:putative intracellular protease/amidase
MPIFDRFTALDCVGPYEVLSRLPGADVIFAAETQDRCGPTLAAWPSWPIPD